jgi:hypothetical protein
MITPKAFMQQYRKLRVPVTRDRITFYYGVAVRKYYINKRGAGPAPLIQKIRAEQAYSTFGNNHDRELRRAAMGKGSPADYQIALRAAAEGGLIDPKTQSPQSFCDQWLGLDCSGLVTNWFRASGRRLFPDQRIANVKSIEYFQKTKTVPDSRFVTTGDVLVLMASNTQVDSSPGHVALVNSFFPLWAGREMEVVEATAAAGASQCPCASKYRVERILEPGQENNDVLLLKVRRFNTSATFAVMAW